MKQHQTSVLLVEDDHWLAESYQNILQKKDFAVLVAHSADEAMRMVENSKPEVLVVDIMLDGHTVMPLLHELQSYDDTKRIPVVVCSALSSSALEAGKLHSYGVVAVLDKATLTPEKFVLTLREVSA